MLAAEPFYPLSVCRNEASNSKFLQEGDDDRETRIVFRRLSVGRRQRRNSQLSGHAFSAIRDRRRRTHTRRISRLRRRTQGHYQKRKENGGSECEGGKCRSKISHHVRCI